MAKRTAYGLKTRKQNNTDINTDVNNEKKILHHF